MLNYEPKPGSVAFRALAHMECSPVGTELTTAALADAIETDPKAMTQYLEAALKHGRIFRRQKGGHERAPFFWSLVDHTKKEPLDRVNGTPKPADEYTEGRNSQRVLKAEPETADATDRETSANASPSVGSMGAGQAADAAAVDGVKFCTTYRIGSDVTHSQVVQAMRLSNHRFRREASERPSPGAPRFGIFSDGEFHMTLSDGRHDVLNRDDFRAMLDFLDSVCLDAVREEGGA